MSTHTHSRRRCECGCGCEELATTTDGGERLCDSCADYYVTDDGDVVCSREQDDRTCRYCGQVIEWGCIQTGQPGVANWVDGRCGCDGREWCQTERGSKWVLSESP